MRQTHLSRYYIYKNDHFTKTGLGQTCGKHSKGEMRFSAGFLWAREPHSGHWAVGAGLWVGAHWTHHTERGWWYNGKKNGLFEPFISKNDHFTKTGLGQTCGKLKKDDRFSYRRRLLGSCSSRSYYCRRWHIIEDVFSTTSSCASGLRVEAAA